ncbi:MAG: YbjQ family protein [Acetobacteraceae bacterium]
MTALKQEAAERGANAVVAMRFDSGEFDSGRGQSMAEITAYGTAVILEPKT